MYSRWYSTAVVILWLSAMSWLVIQKVLPSLLVGQPPSYRTILAAQKRQPPVAWTMALNGRNIGWALCTTSRLPNGLTEIHSRVHFEELPLQELTPGWLRTLLRVAELPTGQLEMDVRSTLTIDPLGRLVRFDSTVQLDQFDDVIKLRGTVEGTALELVVRTGDFSYTTEAYLPANALVGDALSPQTQLPGLRKGQTWTVPTYSPLRPPNNPLEVLQATVEGLEPIIWDGHTEETWLVVYRADPGFRLGGKQKAKGRLWVRRDGTVLEQQMKLLNSTMTFVRLSDHRAARLADEVSDGDH